MKPATLRRKLIAKLAAVDLDHPGAHDQIGRIAFAAETLSVLDQPPPARVRDLEVIDVTAKPAQEQQAS